MDWCLAVAGAAGLQCSSHCGPVGLTGRFNSSFLCLCSWNLESHCPLRVGAHSVGHGKTWAWCYHLCSSELCLGLPEVSERQGRGGEKERKEEPICMFISGLDRKGSLAGKLHENMEPCGLGLGLLP